ncbi:hypothetical protein G4X40_20850 [Rhodococcus sp. D2-41]|uniref:Uncharacterized protein n=1 Tax=Speluncibacter jeojiensis TaxID=2710754 RepID=A0A9X4M4X1_9ACTN|nr:hypothetical protein [Rhodococcus sp. D2-41]MDG3012593.1 hypothetical protein [Rhodococcus sp. D2-41]MDG3015288.1 hypothetical protein [Corynebacteriales bacterium D3-21]
MTDDARDLWDPDEIAVRKQRTAAQVRSWCDRAVLDGRHPELSDTAAVLVAAGYLDEPLRAVLAARRRAGRTLPGIGGFAALRLISDEHRRVRVKLDGPRPVPGQLLLKYRAGELGKRLQMMRSAFVMSGAHYANGVRAVRRDRRDGLHLDLPQREALFAALQRTPTPQASLRWDVAGHAALLGTVDRLAQVWQDLRGAAGSPIPDLRARAADPRQARFADGYETLLYLAGALYDRIDGSPAWHSDHFVMQRVQLDLAEELTQIAVDTVALRGLLAELDAVQRSARDQRTREQVDARRDALRPVWNQLIERVAALVRIAELLTRAEEQLRSITAIERTMSLDSRIDDLIARSGNRELSAENTHNVGDQFGDLDALMGAYQSVLAGDIVALTARTDRWTP